MTGEIVTRRVRLAAVFMILGLLVELVSLGWRRPTAFIFYFVVGGVLLASGILTYLYAIIFKGD